MESIALTQLTALAHPRRLAVFRLLMRRYPDSLPAGEILSVLDVPPSSLSACLTQLIGAGLITMTKSGTSRLYRAETDSAGDLLSYLSAECCRGRPSACLTPANHDLTRVLFVCSSNATRSLCAEALLRHLGGARFQAASAGPTPRSAANPALLSLLQSKGLDAVGLTPTPLAHYQGAGAQEMDIVLTVCDRAANVDAPFYPGVPLASHWGVDPARSDAELSQTYDILERRIQALCTLDFETQPRAQLQTRLDEIARLD